MTGPHTWVEFRAEDTDKLLFRYDPVRDIIEISRRGHRYEESLAEARRELLAPGRDEATVQALLGRRIVFAWADAPDMVVLETADGVRVSFMAQATGERGLGKLAVTAVVSEE